MEKKARWEGKHYAFFCNRACEYFPCHEGIPSEEFNCLFCYCPLYALGTECGGNYRILKNGVKDCSQCAFPHKKENYGRIVAAFGRIVKLFQA